VTPNEINGTFVTFGPPSPEQVDVPQPCARPTEAPTADRSVSRVCDPGLLALGDDLLDPLDRVA
jgi:hypothetical protein